MRRLDSSLKLILPRALETRVVDRLLQRPQWVGPFTTHRVEGHGDAERIETPSEQVRGHAERVQIEILMERSHVAELLQDLGEEVPSGAVFWWLTPVSDSGSLK